MTQLTDLSLGQTAKLLSFGAAERMLRQRLLGMGLHRGALLTVIRKAPLGDPLQIKVGQTHFSLRAGDACELQVQRVEDI